MFYSFERSNWHKSLKGKCNSKEREKEFSIIVRRRKGTFFGKEVLRKCAKSHAKKGMQKGEFFKQKIMPIIYIKGSIVKHTPCMALCEVTNRKVIRDEV